MSGLDPRYVTAPSLQEFFIDKDSGLPLSNGQVFFYVANSGFTTPKPVFEINSVPPNYNYTQLPNPVTLSSVGTFQDGNGNDILPYYFPQDSQGNLQLYDIAVYNSGGVLQWTRMGWPNIVEESESNEFALNFVPNGQFLLHNNVPASAANSFVVNQISQAITSIAQGGWTFERNNGSTATDLVSFISANNTFTTDSRFAVQIQTTVAGSDNEKDLRLKFFDVKTFSSSTQTYNLYFEASCTNGTVPGVEILIIQNLGSGGGSTVTTNVQSITLTTGIQQFNIPLQFPLVTGTIGPNHDDFVQIAIRLPPTGVQTGIFQNFALSPGNATLTTFPQQSEYDQAGPSTAGAITIPSPSGSNLYLPIMLGPEGFIYDTSQIGEIVAESNTSDYTGSVNNFSNKLLCDGSQYRTSDYSALGIPFSRLQQKLLTNGGSVPTFGTGPNFVTCYANAGNSAVMRIGTNLGATVGSFINVATSNPTGFTTSVVASGANYGFQGFSQPQSTALWIRTPAKGLSATVPNAGTSGMTVTSVRDSSVTCSLVQITNVGSASALANTGGAGKYFKFANLSVTYYMWFQITNETDPTPGGTAIKANLLSTDTAADVSQIIPEIVNGYTISNITLTAASSIPANSFFTFNSNNSTSYYVWYNIGGTGIDPKPPGFTAGIQVSIGAGDSAATVTTKTIAAINSFYFAVPDLRGLILRGFTETSSTLYDPDAGLRVGILSSVFGNVIGSLEFDDIITHSHPPLSPSTDFIDSQVGAGSFVATGAGTDWKGDPSTGFTGDTETRPINITVSYAIRY